MLLWELADCSSAVARTRSRREKVLLIAAVLSTAQPGEARIAVSYLAGHPLQRRLGVAWSALAESFPPAARPSLSLRATDAALAEIEGISSKGSVPLRRQRLGALMGQATPLEQGFLQGLISGELRQGALWGVVGEAVAQAAGVELAKLQRAAMLAGDLPVAAEAALEEGEAGLDRFGLRVGTPVQPMLAKSASSLEEALAGVEEAVLEWKLDGVRVQVHREGSVVGVFTRTLEPVAERLPEVVEVARSLDAERFILDGEVIALRDDGHPRPFQETSARVAFRGDPGPLVDSVPLTPFFFDLLHLDGEDLIDLPTKERIGRATRLLPRRYTVPRLLRPSPEEAAAFLGDTLARGHEGVMVKSLAAPYAAGRRGVGWVKVKPRLTLDLVVLAAEWGHGRRQGLLSNLHLGALDEAGGFVMLGKTFKGLTDEMLRWQTKALLALERERQGITVVVAPRLVVEVAFDGVQASPRYPGGVALRFARVLRYREDKGPGDADTIDAVRQLRAR